MYLHNFLTSQPDLNFHNEDVQERCWMLRGSGWIGASTGSASIRSISTSTTKACATILRWPRGAQRETAPAVNPYNHQLHLYDKNQPENLEFLKKLRAVMEPYNAAAVGGLAIASAA